MTKQSFSIQLRGFAIALVSIAFLSSSQTAFCQTVTFSYSGVVQDELTSGTLFLPGVPDIEDDEPFDAFNGQVISLIFSFDSNLTDSNASETRGEYSPTTEYEVQIGDAVYTGSDGTISTSNSTVDTFRFRGSLDGPSLTSSLGIAPYDSASVSLQFRDSSGLIFDDDSLPATQFDLAELTSASLSVSFFSPDGASGSVGSDLLLVAVPEPSSGILLTLAILPIVFRRRRVS